MASSTGLIVTAGAIAMADAALADQWEPNRAVTIIAGVTVSALAAAGLDKVVPGFGTGTAVVLVLAAVIKYGPNIEKRLKLSDLAKGK